MTFRLNFECHHHYKHKISFRMICHMMYFSLFEFLTTADHRLVISGWSYSFENITIKFAILIYLEVPPLGGVKVRFILNRQDFTKFDRNSKRREIHSKKFEFSKNFFTSRFLRVQRGRSAWVHKKFFFGKIFLRSLIVMI